MLGGCRVKLYMYIEFTTDILVKGLRYVRRTDYYLCEVFGATPI